MLQGLCYAPATFQCCMDSILGDLKMSCVLVYLDYVNVFSRTFKDHIKDLEVVFNWLASVNLKLKPKKCSFFKDQLDYLGYLIDKDRLRPLLNKVSAIVNMKILNKKKDIHFF